MAPSGDFTMALDNQHVPDPEFVGPIGLEATINARCADQRCPPKAAALQVRADGALGHTNTMACQQDGADLGSRPGRELVAEAGGFL